MLVPARVRRRASGERLVFWGLLLGAALFIAPPLVVMLWTSITPGFALARPEPNTLQAYVELLRTGDLRAVLADTLEFSIGSVALAVLLGAAMAWGVARTDMLGKKLIYISVFVTFSVPGVIEAIGWIFLLGERAGLVNVALRQVSDLTINIHSMGGVVFVQALSWAPIVFLLLVGPFRNMDASLEESARASGATTSQVHRRVTFPILLPSLASVAILIVIRALQAFEAPYFIGLPAGIRTFTTAIFSSINTGFLPDYTVTAAFGSVLLAVLVVILFVYYRVTGSSERFATVTGKGFRAPVTELGRWRWVPGVLAGLLLALHLAPVVATFLISIIPTIGQPGAGLGDINLANFERLVGYPGLMRGVQNTFTMAAIAATIAVLLCCAAAWIVVRTRIRSRQMLDQVLSIPIVIPGTVLGFGLLITALRVPFALYGTLTLFVIAYVINYSPYGMRFIQPALVQSSAELEEAGFVHGGSAPVVFYRITLPIIASAVAATWLFVFFHAVKDLAVAAMIYTTDSAVVSTQLMDMWANGYIGMASAFGSLITLASVLVGLVAFRLMRRIGL